MIIWWVFYLFDWLASGRFTRFRQAMLPQNTSGQACTRRKGDLGFVVFITFVTLMSAMTIILMQGCKLAITDFAFETQEWLGLPALRLTLLTAHWQPKQWLQTNLSKMVRTPSKPEIMIVCFTNDSCRIHGRFYIILTSNRRKEIR